MFALFLLASLLLVLFAFLNRGGVVEPQLNLVVVSVERPNLLAVLLLTSAGSAAAALLGSAALHAARCRRDARDRRLADLAQAPPLRTKGPSTVGVAAAP